MPRLVIDFLSPVAVLSGIGRPGSVDREVNYNPDSGIPYIPGKTLKGLLREAYGQLYAAESFTEMPPPEKLFGANGMDKGGLLRFGDARPAGDSLEVEAGLESLIRAEMISAIDVLREFTEVRWQTSIDRATGAGKRDTLRSTRLLRSGLKMQAEIEGGTEAHWLLLGLAVKMLRAMGSSRSRGYGAVSCELISDGRNYSEEIIGILEKGGTLPPINPQSGKVLERKKPAIISAVGTAMPFRLYLRESVLLPTAHRVNPNLASSPQAIPGSTIRGLLAWRYLEKYGETDEFARLFCVTPPAIAVGDATAMAVSEVHGRPVFIPSEPIPNSVRKDKDSSYHYDLAEDGPPESKTLTREKGLAPAGWLEKNNQVEKMRVRIRLAYHHQRAKDQRVKRALGSEAAELASYGMERGEQGALFVYESLAARQSFGGHVWCAPELEPLVRELVGVAGETILFGRSRNSEYGGCAEWHWGESSAIPQVEGELDEDTMIVDLLSPLVGYNENGHPVALIPIQEFGENARVEKAFTRRTMVAGFLSHQKRPRQQMPAIDAGSTFVLKGVAPDRMQWILSHGCGLRTEEGFGRLRIRDEGVRRGGSSNWFKEADNSKHPLLQKQDALLEMLFPILIRKIEHYAFDHPLDFSALKGVGTITRPLLHRFMALLEAEDGLSRLETALSAEKLREHARRHLESVRFEDGKNLQELLGEVMKKPVARFDMLAKKGLAEGSLLDKMELAFGNISLIGYLKERLGDAGIKKFVKIYLREYLSHLALEVKRKTGAASSEGGSN